MPKRLTKKQAVELHNLQMCVFAARDKVFASIPDANTPFSACWLAASCETQAWFNKTQADLDRFECDLIAQGRGYRDERGAFYPHRATL